MAYTLKDDDDDDIFTIRHCINCWLHSWIN